MNVGQLVEQFRQDARDTVSPYLWSDAEIIGYLADAEQRFCLLTGGLADASSFAARLKCRADKPFADLAPQVLTVRAAYRTDGTPLRLVNFERLQTTGEGRALFADTPGPIHTLVLGMERNRVRVVHTPTEDQTLNLIVHRLPLDPLTALGQEPEIDEHHHRHLVKWALHLAHLKADAETYDRGRSDQYARDFELYCALAKTEAGRREHVQRTMQFSW